MFDQVVYKPLKVNKQNIALISAIFKREQYMSNTSNSNSFLFK